VPTNIQVLGADKPLIDHKNSAANRTSKQDNLGIPRQ